MTKSFFLKWFYIFIFLELFLMGSGRVLSYDNLTLRMLFFVLSISFSLLYYLINKKIKNYVTTLTFTFTFLILLSSLIGYSSGSPTNKIIEDIKPLLYFFMILPFSLFIINEKSLTLISRLIKISAIVMAFMYLCWLLAMYFGYLDFSLMYIQLSSDSNEIMFRGDSSNAPFLFYKGFLYLSVGFIFFFYEKNKISRIIAMVIFIAIILTLTRGLILSLILSLFLKALLDKKSLVTFLVLIIMSVVILLIAPVYIEIIGERSESDSVRYIQIAQVFNSINYSSFFIGHGFGTGIPIRPDHMEISYLEIFHKQGVFGLVFWFSIIVLITLNYKNIKNQTSLVNSFLASSFFVYALSFTNPFINNSIGMGMLLISLISLDVIKKSERNN